MKIDRKNLIWFIVGLLVGAIVIFVDLYTKHLATEALRTKSIVIIKDFFSLVYVRNTGAAWGIFSNSTQMLSVVSIVTGLALVFAVYCSKSRFFTISTWLIIGGAAGNHYERIHQGFVTDFLAFNIFGYEFPRFNVADSCICIGCALLIIYVLFIAKEGRKTFREGTPMDKLLNISFFKKKEEKKVDEQ